MKKVIVAIITCLLIITYITPFNVFAFDNSDKVILIDPGHGGIDGGAKSKTGTIEKDINLQIALKLRDNLEEKGYKVYMTRDEDEGLPIEVYRLGEADRHYGTTLYRHPYAVFCRLDLVECNGAAFDGSQRGC